MLLSIASAVVIAALFLSLSVNADRYLREEAPHLKPYRFGYFVGLVCCLLALAALYRCAVEFRELAHPGLAPLLLGGAMATAYGILHRRRLGWTMLTVLCLVSPSFTVPLTGTEVAAHAAWAGALFMLPASAIYALRRWREFGDVVERTHRPASDAASLGPDRRIAS